MIINATRMYQNAVRMAAQVSKHVPDTFPGQTEALTSIIYASMSVETFVNEMVFQAEWHCDTHPEAHGSVRAFVDVMNELEASRAPLTAKVLLGKFTLSGQPFDKGEDPYQSFALLTKLRNEIVHQKAHEELKWDEEGNPFIKKRNILESFQALGILGQIETKTEIEPDVLITNWLDDISTRAMAFWACNSASGIVNAVLDATVDDFLRNVLDAEYREPFRQPRANRVLR
jgi:hypothetical protein